MKSLLATLKSMGHEKLAHDLFFNCFPELGSVLKMGDMKTTSLFGWPSSISCSSLTRGNDS